VKRKLEEEEYDMLEWMVTPVHLQPNKSKKVSEVIPMLN
jgi:hypothetical protein